MIATANEGFEYTGNNVLDRALKERFQLILIDYLPHNIEVDLLMKRKLTDRKNADVIVKLAIQVRKMHQQDDLSTAVSVRHTLYAADLVTGGMSLSSALNAAFLPMFTSEEERKKVKDLLASR